MNITVTASRGDVAQVAVDAIRAKLFPGAQFTVREYAGMVAQTTRPKEGQIFGKRKTKPHRDRKGGVK